MLFSSIVVDYKLKLNFMNNDKENTESQESLDSSLEYAPVDNSGDNNQPPVHSTDQITTTKHSGIKNLITKFSEKSSIYLPIFIILIIAVAIITYIVYQNVNAPQATLSEQTLSPSTLNKLANNNQVVGSSNQLLTVQSSSIFDGPVLLRGNLGVAGKLQVGGSLSLTGITVSGNSIFNQMQISKNLSVGGNTTVQGNLVVQQGLTVNGGGTFAGAISAPQLTVGSLQLNGDLTLTHHIYAGGPIPSRVTSSSVGSGGTTSVNGSDTAGTITINTGGNPSAGCYLTINFVTAFNNTPHVLVTPVGPNSASLVYYVNRTTNNFSLCSTNSPQPAQSYTFDYFVVG